MTPDIAKEGGIPKNNSKPTYSRDPPYIPSIAGPDLSIPSGDQDVSTPFLIQQDTDLPPPAYPGTGYSSDHYTTPANPSVHQGLPYSFREALLIPTWKGEESAQKSKYSQVTLGKTLLLGRGGENFHKAPKFIKSIQFNQHFPT